MKTVILLFLLLLLSACAPKEPGIKPPFIINPYEFYERFNLRTIISSYSAYLKYYCASYPKDFFRPDQLRMPDLETLVIENEERKLMFEMHSEDEVIVTDEVKDGSYLSRYIYKVYYNEEHDDFRTDRFFIRKSENCQNFVINDVNQSLR